MSIGRDTTVREHSFLLARGHEGTKSLLRIGDRVQFGRFVVVNATTGIDVGDDVVAADSAAIIDSWGPLEGPRASTAPPPAGQAVVVEAGAYLSEGCVVCPGVRIGRGAYIGPGAVVTDDVPARGAAYGNPARLAGPREPERPGRPGTEFGMSPSPPSDGSRHGAADGARDAPPLWVRWAKATRDTAPTPAAFARFGARSVIIPPSHVWGPGSVAVGSDVIIREHSWIAVLNAARGTGRLTIGDRVRIGASARIVCVGAIEIGDEVLTGNRVALGATDFVDPDALVISPTLGSGVNVTIGRGAWLGIASTVRPGVTVGEQAYVGAGAVVTEDVAPRTLVVGNPAVAVCAYDAETRAWVQIA